ncbi:AAA family ATPase [Geothermobacter hydrogeniphilus]|uniref:AAA family ATPase n=1 Tax=Geothermobacter hydrogeniphilus TaxID=1969733 RepID=A0A2K2HF33_9BACT|nr:ATP-binding protein [Geothermobacter hydrogeniphilus]PNU21821.1 AAA family ATPase [Geothermobacter hydrogeniphilus]
MIQTKSLYPRLLEKQIDDALADTPVVLVAGPRQAGKTTLVRQLASREMRYLTLDDQLTLLAAQEDPTGLVRNLDRAIIDEIQRAPQLLLAIKKAVDEDRRPGRFLLTGSTNLMTLPTVADSLAGRMETLTLLPLSQNEIHGGSTNWIERAYEGRIPDVKQVFLGEKLDQIVLQGGYPEAISRATPRRRVAWHRQYIDAIIQRDVREVADIDKLDLLPKFVQALAQVSGQLCNYSQVAGQVGLDHKTAARYLGTLEQLFLLRRIEPWAHNRLKRMVKTPKVQFLDSGLLAALADITPGRIHQDRACFGTVLETFVFSELLKHSMTANSTYRLLYYRDHDQYEVDFVIENAMGELIGVEVKAAATVQGRDLRGLKRLANVAGKQFRLGVILYDGTETLPLGDRLWAAPLSSLWGG